MMMKSFPAPWYLVKAILMGSFCLLSRDPGDVLREIGADLSVGVGWCCMVESWPVVGLIVRDRRKKMIDSTKSVLVALILVTCSAPCVTGCLADNDSSVFIRQVIKPNSDCDFVNDPSSGSILSGVLDVSFRGSYTAGLLIGNQLMSRKTINGQTAETSHFRAEGVVSRVEDWDGTALSEFSTVVVGMATAGTSSEPGWGAVSSVILDETASAVLRKRLTDNPSLGVVRTVAMVSVFGETLGGQKLETGVFKFPINVCRGCLLRIPQKAVDTTKPTPNCLRNEDAPDQKLCFPGQDAEVDCRTCKALGFPVSVCKG